MNKKQLRQEYAALRNSMCPEEVCAKSEIIQQILFQTQAYIQAEKVFTYLHMGTEVQTVRIVMDALARGKRVAVPRVVSRDEMCFIEVHDLQTLQKSRFGVPEPTGDSELACDRNSVVLVPGLVFSKTGFRIGYGGGYYDKFLCGIETFHKIGLAFDRQLTDKIQPEAHDVAMDMVLTESGIWHKKVE